MIEPDDFDTPDFFDGEDYFNEITTRHLQPALSVWKFKFQRRDFWITREGKEIPYPDLKDSHLLNIAKMFGENITEGISKELKNRGLNNDN